MIDEIEIATVTSRGQITLPAPVRRKLGIKTGGKVAFIEQDGHFLVENVNMLQLREKSMDFATEDLLVFSTEQISKMNKDDEW